MIYVLVSSPGIKPYLEDFLVTGILGAFTTYSTFSFEIINLIDIGNIKTAVFYVLASLAAGLLSVLAGMALALYF